LVFVSKRRCSLESFRDQIKEPFSESWRSKYSREVARDGPVGARNALGEHAVFWQRARWCIRAGGSLDSYRGVKLLLARECVGAEHTVLDDRLKRGLDLAKELFAAFGRVRRGADVLESSCVEIPAARA
jgi:hypothetical protein